MTPDAVVRALLLLLVPGLVLVAVALVAAVLWLNGLDPDGDGRDRDRWR